MQNIRNQRIKSSRRAAIVGELKLPIASRIRKRAIPVIRRSLRAIAQIADIWIFSGEGHSTNKLVFTAIVAASILAPPIASHAVDANGNIVVYGNGVDTCAEVLVHTSTGERQTMEYWRMIYLQWLTGYMSGYVADTHGAVDVSFGLPNSAVLDALLSTCSGMPKEIFAHVARKNLEGLTSIK